MILMNPEDQSAQEQLEAEIEMIRVRCPEFVEMIRQSVEHTSDLIGNTDGTDLLKHSGALRDLRTISRLFDSAPESDAPARNPIADAQFGTAYV